MKADRQCPSKDFTHLDYLIPSRYLLIWLLGSRVNWLGCGTESPDCLSLTLIHGGSHSGVNIFQFQLLGCIEYIKSLVSVDIVVLCQSGSESWKFGADISSVSMIIIIIIIFLFVSPSSEQILKGYCLKCQLYFLFMVAIWPL